MSTTIERITLNTALKKKKTLEKRIESLISSMEPVGILKGKKVIGKLLNEQEFKELVTSQCRELRDLIAQKDYLDITISKANLETTTVIKGRTYSISELIILRNNLDNKKHLLNKLRNSYRQANEMLEEEYDRVERRADDMLRTELGVSSQDVKNKTLDKDARDEHKAFIERNTPKLVDTLDLSNLIKKLEDFIIEFDEVVDSRLSDLNGTTTIPFDTGMIRSTELLIPVFDK